ncbi:extracellular protein, putative [Cordyceps militaris]|uniref:Extracellular protein, putative n=1 Tax=Cordyceps militaris TaxID=73501 RepID=A0A2H4S5E9_CORMI|nr:extracellular protein, putative [Cordyceps militaris]
MLGQLPCSRDQKHSNLQKALDGPSLGLHFFMQIIASVAAILGMAASASAHMALTNPAPLGSPKNGGSDYDMKSPLNADGSNFPCRGHLNLLGTAGGKSVATWPAGSKQTLSIDGSAWHSGGSCQASLSYDKGKTWTVIYSWLGSCPSGPGPSSYDFSVPADATAGEAIFAWSWFNKVGNREMYMNCAVVEISGSKSKKRRGVAMSARPAMFVANVGNGCGTSEGTDLQFPDPGPDVVTKGSNFGPPTGKCAGSGSPAPPPAPAPSSSAAAPSAPPAASSSAPVASSSAPVASSSAPAAPVPAPSGTQKPSPSAPGGVFITVSQSTGVATSLPTTVQTIVRPTQSAPAPSNSAPAVTNSAPAPAPTVSAPTASAPVATPAPTGGSGSNGYAAWSPCQDLGAWNCIDGKQFQRCGAGNMWSPPQGLAAGTSCQSGVAKDIIFV